MPGRSLWSTVSGLSFSSSAVRPRENGLSTGSVKYIGKSTRRPNVRFSRSEASNSSWAYTPSWPTSMFSPLNGPVPISRVEVLEVGLLGSVAAKNSSSELKVLPGGMAAGQEEDAVPEDVERVEEAEPLVVAAEGERVPPLEQREVVGELEDVLVQDVVDRERLVAQRGVGDAALADLDGGEGLAERRPVSRGTGCSWRRTGWRTELARLFSSSANECRSLLIA